jgi:serine/threonine protein kinase
MPLAPGEVFAGYTIVRLLGSGGMGEVYLAQHPRLPRSDALKILPADVSADPDFRARFNREADLAATLFHPHIVGVPDRGEYEGLIWIAMDFVDGADAGRSPDSPAPPDSHDRSAPQPGAASHTGPSPHPTRPPRRATHPDHSKTCSNDICSDRQILVHPHQMGSAVDPLVSPGWRWVIRRIGSRRPSRSGLARQSPTAG